MAFSHILNCIIASTSRWEQLWNHSLQWTRSLPLSHTLLKTAHRNWRKVNKREPKQTLVMSERAHSQTESTTCLSMLPPHYWGICDVPFERLEWAKQADWLLARWARRGWAVWCCAYSRTPSPLCGLGPAAVHQPPRPCAGDDAFCRLKKPL